jgi:shikimate dehydrogenase
MHAIDGSTRLAGVVGTPLTHSLSPAMHNAAYQHLDLDWVYVPLDVGDELGLRRLVAAVRSLDFVGFSVTMPYKKAMLDLCDEVAMAASMAGAVNTVHCSEGRLIGYNTDGRGLLEALELEAGFVPADREVVVIGAGGAASAAVVALILARAASVTVAARDISRAEQLVASMEPHAGQVGLAAMELSAAEHAVASAALVINATPVGMRASDVSPVPREWWSEGQVVYDMVYGTRQATALVTDANAAGARAFDGLGMLVSQGATAIDIWNGTGVRAPREIMHEAAERALAARTGER